MTGDERVLLFVLGVWGLLMVGLVSFIVFRVLVYPIWTWLW